MPSCGWSPARNWPQAIAAAFSVSRTAISQHVTVLKNAGLLTERRDGTRRLYRGRPEGLAGLRAFLEEMWAGSLDTARGRRCAR